MPAPRPGRRRDLRLAALAAAAVVAAGCTTAPDPLPVASTTPALGTTPALATPPAASTAPTAQPEPRSNLLPSAAGTGGEDKQEGGLTLTFALDFEDRTAEQRQLPPQDVPESAFIVDEQFEDEARAVLRPFEDPPARGLFGSVEDVRFFDMVVGEPDSIVTSPITGVPAEELLDVGLVTSSFAINLEGPPDVSTGLFCWGGEGKGLSAADQSRYELRVQPDRRLVVDRIRADGQIAARLIQLELDLPPDRATFARLFCRRGPDGEVQIGAGWTQREEGGSAWTVDPDPLRPGGSAGILMRTGEHAASADTFISFVQLLVFDAAVLDVR
jgi:hypothetical protein